MNQNEDYLSPCCGKEVAVFKSIWGEVCHACHTEYNDLDRTTDWDQHEADKRECIVESNEY